MNKRSRRQGQPSQHFHGTRAAQLLLDGLIAYRLELGEVGWQLEQLLRIRGVRATIDPVFSANYH